LLVPFQVIQFLSLTDIDICKLRITMNGLLISEDSLFMTLKMGKYTPLYVVALGPGGVETYSLLTGRESFLITLKHPLRKPFFEMHRSITGNQAYSLLVSTKSFFITLKYYESVSHTVVCSNLNGLIRNACEGSFIGGKGLLITIEQKETIPLVVIHSRLDRLIGCKKKSLIQGMESLLITLERIESKAHSIVCISIMRVEAQSLPIGR